MKEVWKDVVGYEGRYQVSNLGRVKSINYVKRRDEIKEIIMKPYIARGYIKVNFNVSGKQTSKSVHRLVAEAFISNPQNKEEVNHIDGDKKNNTIVNLEWSTRQENIDHSWEFGLTNMSAWKNKIRKVDKLNLNGEYICTYDSIAEATRDVEATRGNIGHVCARGRGTCMGYKWRYTEEVL